MMDQKVIRKIKAFERRGAITVDHLARMMDDRSKERDEVKNFLQETFHFNSLKSERKNIRKVNNLSQCAAEWLRVFVVVAGCAMDSVPRLQIDCNRHWCSSL